MHIGEEVQLSGDNCTGSTSQGEGGWSGWVPVVCLIFRLFLCHFSAFGEPIPILSKDLHKIYTLCISVRKSLKQLCS